MFVCRSNEYFSTIVAMRRSLPRETGTTVGRKSHFYAHGTHGATAPINTSCDTRLHARRETHLASRGIERLPQSAEKTGVACCSLTMNSQRPTLT